MAAAIEAARATFVALAEGRVELPLRLALPLHPGAVSLVMGASAPRVGAVAKLVSVVPRNAERGLPRTIGVVNLVDPETGALAAVLDGAALTALRTGAVSGLATQLLAPVDARRAAIIGAGQQGQTQLLAIDAVRELERVRIYARTPASVAAFIETMQGRVRPRLEPASSPAQAVEDAQIVCAATGASSPVFPGEALAPDVHINAVGSFRLDMLELDRATIEGAAIVVDQRDAAAEEAGELVDAAEAGITSLGAWRELGSLLREPPSTRLAPKTLFKSVGLAAQDLFAAAAAHARAREQGLGAPLHSQAKS